MHWKIWYSRIACFLSYHYQQDHGGDYCTKRAPEYTVLTDRRILYFNEKILNRYDLADIPYSRLQEMKAVRSRMRFGSIEFTGEDKSRIRLKRVPKDSVQPFVEARAQVLSSIYVHSP